MPTVILGMGETTANEQCWSELTFIHHIRLQRYKGQKEIFALF
jgi:hypothetical protein